MRVMSAIRLTLRIFLTCKTRSRGSRRGDRIGTKNAVELLIVRFLKSRSLGGKRVILAVICMTDLTADGAIMICRQNIHFFFTAMALWLLAHGCTEKTAEYKFSGAIEGGFDPVAAFRKDGLTISAEAEGERIRNPPLGYPSAQGTPYLEETATQGLRK